MKGARNIYKGIWLVKMGAPYWAEKVHQGQDRIRLIVIILLIWHHLRKHDLSLKSQHPCLFLIGFIWNQFMNKFAEMDNRQLVGLRHSG